MDTGHIERLFEMYSGETLTGIISEMIDMSVLEVKKMLRPGADEDDVRLDFLAAAITNFRVQQINSSSSKGEYNYAGRLKSNDGNAPLMCARSVLRDMYQHCGDLITPEVFIFSAFSSEEGT